MNSINSKTFFRVALLLPVATPLLFLPFSFNAALGVLLLSLTFGGVQYLAFSLMMFWIIGRKKNSTKLKWLLYRAQLIFLPFQAIGWILDCLHEKTYNPELVGLWEALIPFSFYTLLIGYVYVILVAIFYYVCCRLCWVSDTSHYQ